jgi:hypothetical protein
MRLTGADPAASTLRPVVRAQTDSLRKVMGAYKRTPVAITEREAGIPPIDLYVKAGRLKKALKTQGTKVTQDIKRAADHVWSTMRRRGARATHRPPTCYEKTRTLAEEITEEIWEHQQALCLARAQCQGRRPRPAAKPPPNQLIKQWQRLEWERRWKKILQARGMGHQPVAWSTPWEQEPRKLYADLPKAQATALFLMRTEVIGLNSWLAGIGVPGTLPQCSCGWHAQTVRHVLLHCPRLDRAQLLQQCQTEVMEEILGNPEKAKHAARWLVASGVMEQFRVAKEVEEEDLEGYKAFPDVRDW